MNSKTLINWKTKTTNMQSRIFISNSTSWWGKVSKSVKFWPMENKRIQMLGWTENQQLTISHNLVKVWGMSISLVHRSIIKLNPWGIWSCVLFLWDYLIVYGGYFYLYFLWSCKNLRVQSLVLWQHKKVSYFWLAVFIFVSFGKVQPRRSIRPGKIINIYK